MIDQNPAPVDSRSPSPGAVATEPAPPVRLGTGLYLLLWLWPVALVAAGVLFVQYQTRAMLDAAMAERPRVVIVDESQLIKQAALRGADIDNPLQVRAVLANELQALARDDTIVLPRNVVTTAPPRFYVGGQHGAQQPQ